MLCELFTADGKHKLLSFECLPICEVDYCESCGDCLTCFDEDECSDGGSHMWAVYLDKAMAFMAAHQLDQHVGEQIGAEIRKEYRQ